MQLKVNASPLAATAAPSYGAVSSSAEPQPSENESTFGPDLRGLLEQFGKGTPLDQDAGEPIELNDPLAHYYDASSPAEPAEAYLPTEPARDSEGETTRLWGKLLEGLSPNDPYAPLVMELAAPVAESNEPIRDRLLGIKQNWNAASADDPQHALQFERLRQSLQPAPDPGLLGILGRLLS